MIVREILNLVEARQEHPDVTYSFKEVKGKLASITVKLEKSKSGSLTKLAKRYKEIDEAVKQLNLERDEMNATIKSQFSEYFEAEDAIATRIIETVSLTAQLAKQAEDSSKTDDTEVVAKLLETATPELAEQIRNLQAACQKITKAKSPALTVKVSEGILETLKATIVKLAKLVSTWANSYDKKLERIRSKLE